MSKLKSWSFSRYSDYKLCPQKFNFKHLLKYPEPKSAAMDRGNAIHKQAEDYITGKLLKLPVELQAMKAELQRLRKLYKAKRWPMIVEDNWAFTRDWEETQWNNWVECWVRIKLDCAHYEDGTTMYITDWKTGKFSEYSVADYLEQLELYALAALLMSAVENVTVVPRLAYTDLGTFYPAPGAELRYTRADIPRLQKLWEKRVKAMFADAKFAPRPNRLCGWCHYRQANKAAGGGQCKF